MWSRSVGFLVVALLAGTCCMADSASAQGSGRIVLQRIGGPVRLDGPSFEPAWEGIQPFLPTQYEPENGAPPTERTEFRIAYDDNFLYFSLRAYDRDPAGIRSNTLYRDRLSGDDHFEILIDQFNDKETGIVFTTTPAGIRRESALSNDATGGSIASGGWLNTTFNTYWDVATAVSDSGWFAELRVPFSSLRFHADEDGTVVMGMSLQRKIARRTERLVFPSVRRVANFAFLKPSLAQEFVLEGIRPRLPTYVTPYVLAGRGVTSVTGPEPGFRHESNMQREIGGDVKFNLSNQTTLDLTINTDFAQVEADDEQINLTRFNLFFPEKRQFFQERGSLFEFQTGANSRLFHSRRIGLTEAGQPVRILGGTRLVGSYGAWDVGIMDLQTAKDGGLPSENFGVVRARRRVFNPYSYAGGMATTRIGSDGDYNLAYGLDGVFRLRGDDYLTLQWANTFDRDVIKADTLGMLDSGLLTVELARRRRERWGYEAAFSWTGAGYDPGIGFIQRRDFAMLDNSVGYTWLHGEKSRFIFNALSLESVIFRRNGDGRIESAEIGPFWEWAAKSGEGGTVEARVVYEDLLVPFALSSNATIPAGSYTFFRVGASYHETHTQLIQTKPQLEVGTFYDGWQMTAAVNPVWYVSPHLELSGGYQYSRVRFPDRNEGLDAHLVRLRIGTALNTQISTTAFLQYNSERKAMSANVRFRYNIREGNDLWIVYNEGLNTDRYRVDPALLLTDNRTLLLKYTHTFGI